MTVSLLYGSAEYLNTTSISDFKGPFPGLREFVTTESSLNMMKNDFYVVVKAFFFFLKIFTILSWLFGHADVNLKIYDVTDWKQIVTLHILPNIYRWSLDRI